MPGVDWHIIEIVKGTLFFPNKGKVSHNLNPWFSKWLQWNQSPSWVLAPCMYTFIRGGEVEHTMYNWGPVYQKNVSREGTSNFILKYIWDVITCPCPDICCWHKSSISVIDLQTPWAGSTLPVCLKVQPVTPITCKYLTRVGVMNATWQ